jgi:hypothetical protein
MRLRGLGRLCGPHRSRDSSFLPRAPTDPLLRAIMCSVRRFLTATRRASGARFSVAPAGGSAQHAGDSLSICLFLGMSLQAMNLRRSAAGRPPQGAQRSNPGDCLAISRFLGLAPQATNDRRSAAGRPNQSVADHAFRVLGKRGCPRSARFIPAPNAAVVHSLRGSAPGISTRTTS